MIKVSVVIPVYNVEKYIDRCLSSVINQTYSFIEIILINDGSQDHSANICDNIASKDDRISVIHKKNEGPSAARNLGTKLARGEYILYVDSDDELPSDAIESLVTKLNEYPQSEIIIGEIHSAPKDPFGYHFSYYKNVDYIEDNLWIRQHFYKTNHRLPTNPVNKLIQSSFLKENELSFKEGIIHEDELWMFFLVQKASKIAFVHKNTYIRHINPGSIMTGTTQEKKNLAWGNILNIIFSNISNPCETELFFTYTMLWMKHFRSHDKNFHSSWSKMDIFLKRKKMSFIRMLLVFFKASHPVLKGHGIGFVIWILVKYGYKQNV